MLNLKTKIRASLSLIPMLLLPVSSGFSAAAPTIGVATANGKFTLNHASHRNNATLFEGNTFDSGTSELEFRLVDGTIVQLGASARGNVFADHILIVEGGGDVHADAMYPVEALGLQIKSTQKGRRGTNCREWRQGPGGCASRRVEGIERQGRSAGDDAQAKVTRSHRQVQGTSCRCSGCRGCGRRWNRGSGRREHNHDRRRSGYRQRGCGGRNHRCGQLRE